MFDLFMDVAEECVGDKRVVDIPRSHSNGLSINTNNNDCGATATVVKVVE